MILCLITQVAWGWSGPSGNDPVQWQVQSEAAVAEINRIGNPEKQSQQRILYDAAWNKAPWNSKWPTPYKAQAPAPKQPWPPKFAQALAANFKGYTDQQLQALLNEWQVAKNAGTYDDNAAGAPLNFANAVKAEIATRNAAPPPPPVDPFAGLDPSVQNAYQEVIKAGKALNTAIDASLDAPRANALKARMDDDFAQVFVLKP